MRKCAWSLIALALAGACTIERPGPEMGWEMQAVQDAVVGQYELYAASWDGPALDVGGDGDVQGDFLSRLWDGLWAGSCTLGPSGRPTFTIYGLFPDLAYYPWSYASFLLPVFCQADEPYAAVRGDKKGLAYYRLTEIPVRLFFLTDGSCQGETEIEGQFSWENGEIVFSCDTSFYDHLTGQTVSGRATFRYLCVSSKQKKS